MVSTVRISHPNYPKGILINATDFNEAIHQRYKNPKIEESLADKREGVEKSDKQESVRKRPEVPADKQNPDKV